MLSLRVPEKCGVGRWQPALPPLLYKEEITAGEYWAPWASRMLGSGGLENGLLGLRGRRKWKERAVRGWSGLLPGSGFGYKSRGEPSGWS